MRASEAVLVKAFRLETKQSLTNMHAFDVNGSMKKFTSVEEILRSFFQVRMALYGRRKEFLVNVTANELATITNKVRFLDAVVSGDFVFRGRRKPELIADLEARSFAKRQNGFDYLLNQPLWNLTTEKLDSLRQQKVACQQKLANLQRTSPSAMWLADLSAIQNNLDSLKRSASASGNSTKRKKE